MDNQINQIYIQLPAKMNACNNVLSHTFSMHADVTIHVDSNLFGSGCDGNVGSGCDGNVGSGCDGNVGSGDGNVGSGCDGNVGSGCDSNVGFGCDSPLNSCTEGV